MPATPVFDYASESRAHARRMNVLLGDVHTRDAEARAAIRAAFTPAPVQEITEAQRRAATAKVNASMAGVPPAIDLSKRIRAARGTR